MCPGLASYWQLIAAPPLQAMSQQTVRIPRNHLADISVSLAGAPAAERPETLQYLARGMAQLDGRKETAPSPAGWPPHRFLGSNLRSVRVSSTRMGWGDGEGRLLLSSAIDLLLLVDG